MKTITIGDIHGKNSWKLIDILKYDKIIFIGDYVDSFIESDVSIIDNLLDIIQLKCDFPDKVILLLGNHDIQYLFNNPSFRCSGYRNSYSLKLEEIFNKNYNLFQLSFQIKNYLWTHAGVHRGWFYERMIPAMTNILKNDENGLISTKESYAFSSISEELNFLFSIQYDIIFDVCRLRGGDKHVGGPLWADKNNTFKKPLKGFNQIVGHTNVHHIKTFNCGNNTSITYTDCLNNKNEFYKLEI